MRYLALLPILALAACGSSGGPVGPLPPMDGWVVVNPADMPTTGSADFSGGIKMDVGALDEEGEGGSMTSNLDLRANFADGSITGTASNFNDSEVGALRGTATMNNGRINGNAMSGTMTGALSGADDGEVFTGSIFLDLSGNFMTKVLGGGPDGVSGAVDGIYSVTGVGSTGLDGEFAAIR